MTKTRKIDALIAEHIFGLNVAGDCYEIDDTTGIGKNIKVLVPVPNYSTSNDAWLVLEELLKQELIDDITIDDYFGQFRITQSNDMVYVKANTLRLAICLAALSALEINLEEETEERTEGLEKETERSGVRE